MLNLKNIISLTEARRRFFELAQIVQNPGTHYILTENGKPKVVVLSAEEYEGMQETIETLAEDPDIIKLAKQADEAVLSSDLSDYTSFDDYLKEEGLVVAEKGGKYVIQHSSKSSGKKTTKKTPSKSKK